MAQSVLIRQSIDSIDDDMLVTGKVLDTEGRITHRFVRQTWRAVKADLSTRCYKDLQIDQMSPI